MNRDIEYLLYTYIYTNPRGGRALELIVVVIPSYSAFTSVYFVYIFLRWKKKDWLWLRRAEELSNDVTTSTILRRSPAVDNSTWPNTSICEYMLIPGWYIIKVSISDWITVRRFLVLHCFTTSWALISIYHKEERLWLHDGK